MISKTYHYLDPIGSKKELINLIKAGQKEYAIFLNGNIFSKKTIDFNEKTKTFHIFNHTDDTETKVKDNDFFTTDTTNVGKAVSYKALFPQYRL